jgi:hypothetical protein
VAKNLIGSIPFSFFTRVLDNLLKRQSLRLQPESQTKSINSYNNNINMKFIGLVVNQHNLFLLQTLLKWLGVWLRLDGGEVLELTDIEKRLLRT